MASILVRYKKSNRFRMWNNTVDCWETDKMNREQAISYCIHSDGCSLNEAEKRVDRVGYDRSHLKWLNRFFDSRTGQLQKTHKINMSR